MLSVEKNVDMQWIATFVAAIRTQFVVVEIAIASQISIEVSLILFVPLAPMDVIRAETLENLLFEKGKKSKAQISLEALVIAQLISFFAFTAYVETPLLPRIRKFKTSSHL